jgi:hypothetical protein
MSGFSSILPLLLILINLLGSCATSQIPLTVLKPASLTLPASIRSISVIPVPGLVAEKHKFENIDEILLHDTTDVRQIRLGYLSGIYDIFKQSPRFDRVVFSDSSYAGFPDQHILYWDDLRKVCTHDTTDVILLLQKAICQDRLFSQEYIGTSLYYSVYKITNLTKWSFLQPFREITLATIVDTDSLTLDGNFGLMGDPEYNLFKACYTSGVMTGCKISPYWQDTIRTYFTGPGRDMKDAAQFVEKNRWYNATRLWNEVLETGNNRRASRAAYNIALAFETDDDLEQAFSWILYADSLHSSQHTESYIKILEVRLKKEPVLEQQLSGR